MFNPFFASDEATWGLGFVILTRYVYNQNQRAAGKTSRANIGTHDAPYPDCRVVLIFEGNPPNKSVIIKGDSLTINQVIVTLCPTVMELDSHSRGLAAKTRRGAKPPGS